LTSIYYGINEDYYDYAVDKLISRESLLKNKLSNEGRNNRYLIIQKIALQIEVIEIDEKRSKSFSIFRRSKKVTLEY
jgi:hypothetical protein